jgi:SAM-dependent methyltransferase
MPQDTTEAGRVGGGDGTTAGPLPLPPGELCFLVAGSKDSREFLTLGKRGFDSLLGLLDRNGISVRELDGVLDFGCGCGRVMRYWHGMSVKRIAGSDCNPALVEWCRESLRFAAVQTNNLEPPLGLASGSFDLVYAFSVFTHLPERLQFAWLRELGRILRLGGHLVISTHGPAHLDVISEDGARQLVFFPPWQQELFRHGQLVVIGTELAGANGCAAFHPVPFVKEVLAPCCGYSVIDWVEKGALGNPHQDLWLLRKEANAQVLGRGPQAGEVFEEWYLGVLEGYDAAMRRRQEELQRMLDGVFQSRGWKLLQLLRGMIGRRWNV